MLNVINNDLLIVCIIATASVGAGLMLNQGRKQPLPLFYLSKESRMHLALLHLTENQTNVVAVNSNEGESENTLQLNGSLKLIDLAVFRVFVATKRGLILDARPEIFYRLGHVPGALSVSRETFESDYHKFGPLLEVNRGKPIAVYCSASDCEDSQMLAEALAKFGYHDVLIFKGGWNQWIQAGLLQEH